MGRHNRDHKRHRNAATSAAMLRLAEARKCRTCNRKGGVAVLDLDPWTVVSRCRYCGHEEEVRGCSNQST